MSSNVESHNVSTDVSPARQQPTTMMPGRVRYPPTWRNGLIAPSNKYEDVGTRGPKIMELTHSSFCPMRFPSRMVWPVKMAAPWTQGWKKPGKKKKTSPVYSFFWGFLGIFFCFVFFLVFFLNIVAQNREFLGFFQFQEIILLLF
jgi:hypothetical protein